MDLTTLSFAELKDLLVRIPQELRRREAQEKAMLLEEMKSLVQSRGFTFEQLVGEDVKLPSKTKGVPVKVKYRHPENAALQWTGRGRKPQWVVAWLDAGNSIDALAV
ncbi:MAG: hypothetical protein RIR00_350 [Pseudomonadota bacterium]